MKFRKPPRRSPIRRDPVFPEVRDYVLRRDGRCLASRITEGHVCRDRYGNVHAPTDQLRLTVDHVKEEARLGRRAPSDPAHLVALCWDANVNGWASAHRIEERAYLRVVESPTGEHEWHVDPVAGCEACFQAVAR